ncbi:MAG: hypothetical protein ACRDGV_08705 [Candidatus Limnocylindria bacterium]
MNDDRDRPDRPQQDEEAATSVDEPSGRPPDEGLAYDPTMTEGDEANAPPDSAAQGDDKTRGARPT